MPDIPPAVRDDLLTYLFCRSPDRAALIGRLYARAHAERLAELLMDLEGEDGEPARLRLAESLRLDLG